MQRVAVPMCHNTTTHTNTMGEHVVCINTFAWLTECTHHVNHHTHTHTWCLVGCTTT